MAATTFGDYADYLETLCPVRIRATFRARHRVQEGRSSCHYWVALLKRARSWTDAQRAQWSDPRYWIG